MKRMLAMLILLACDSSATTDAGSDTGGPPQCDGGCGITLDDYCKLNACPSDPTAEVAAICADTSHGGIKVYSGCGYTFVFATETDTSEETIFAADGGLVGIYHSGVLGTCCTAGPPGFVVPNIQGCTLSQPTCDSGVTD